MDDAQIEDLIRKLKKRGFITDGVREHCDQCNQSGQAIFKLASRLGGRDIRWCFACGVIRSWRRHADGHLVEDTPFNIVKFLE